MGRTSRVSFLVAVLAVAVVAIGGCQFPRPPDVEATDASPPIDRTPTEPQLETSRDPKDFGSVVIGGNSATYTLMVQNVGDLPAGTIGVSLTGASPSEFEIVPTGDSSDCSGRALAGGETCRAQVRYKPTVDQGAAASFVIAAEPGGTIAVPISGDAQTSARLTSLTATENFGGVVLGASSLIHHITIQNDGEQPTGPLGLSKAGPNQAEFTIIPLATDDCQGATLGQQGTCQIDVRFTPAAAGTQRTATITVAGTPGGMYAITATGDGLNPGDLTIEQPTGGVTLDFGARDLGTGVTSATQTIRVRNTGGVATGPLSVSVTGAAAASFTLPNDGCSGNPLGANATCDVAVRFNPQAIGAQPATIQIRDNTSGSTQAVNATGVGTGTISLQKVGAGSVLSTPAGINCSSVCVSQSGAFAVPQVTLTATPDPGWTFDRWEGACAVATTSPTCTVAIGATVANVTAYFQRVYTLSVANCLSHNSSCAGKPLSGGTITSNPGGINCAWMCSAEFPAGATVTLTATPNAGNEVGAWNGASCPPMQRTCTVLMNSAKNVTVAFEPVPTVPQPSSPPNGGHVGSVHVPSSLRPTFRWHPSTISFGSPISGYDLQYSEDASFATGVTQIQGVQLYQTPSLPVSSTAPVGRRYYWRVRACAADVCSAYSPPFMVNVGVSDHDVDGDGYADLFVASPFVRNAGGSIVGKISMYFGGPAAAPPLTSRPPVTTTGTPLAPLEASGVQPWADVGDVNGDGFSDVVVGVSHDDTNGENSGRVDVYLGGLTFDYVPDLQIFGVTPSSGVGGVLALGDYNGDGADDIAIGGRYDAPGQCCLGRVDVYFGGSSIDDVPDWSRIGAVSGQAFGGQLIAADVSGDGRDDLLVYQGGAFYLYTGGTALTATGISLPACYHHTAGGDLNGDGYQDTLCQTVSCSGGACSAAGVVQLWGAGGVVASVNLDIPDDGVWDHPDDRSTVMARLGDVNRDGFDDIALGEAGPDTLGSLWVYLGGDVVGPVFDPVPDGLYHGDVFRGRVGYSIAGGADVNGDGFNDFVSGAPGEGQPYSAAPGRALLFYGFPFDMNPDIVVQGGGVSEWFGWACSL